MNCCSEACEASLCMQHLWRVCLRPPTQWAGSQCNMGFAAQHAIPGSAGSHLRWQMQVRLWCPSGATSSVIRIPSSGMWDFGMLTVWDARCWIVGCYSTTKFAKAHNPIWLPCWEEFQHVSWCIYLHKLNSVVRMQGAMDHWSFIACIMSFTNHARGCHWNFHFVINIEMSPFTLIKKQ